MILLVILTTIFTFGIMCGLASISNQLNVIIENQIEIIRNLKQ